MKSNYKDDHIKIPAIIKNLKNQPNMCFMMRVHEITNTIKGQIMTTIYKLLTRLCFAFFNIKEKV